MIEQGCVGREELDLHRLGRVRKVADHVLQHLDEFDVDARLALGNLGPQLGDDFLHATIAFVLQLDRNIAGIGLGHRGQAKLQPGAAGEALYFGHLRQHALDLHHHAVGLFERCARRRDVVDYEAAFVHCGEQVGSECAVAEKRSSDEHDGEEAQPERTLQCESQGALVEVDNFPEEVPQRGFFSRQQALALAHALQFGVVERFLLMDEVLAECGRPA